MAERTMRTVSAYDLYGDSWRTSEINAMTEPVRCRWCSRVYDLATVKVTARYTDCSMWRSPCCDNLVDDRGDYGWGVKHYEKLSRR